MTTTERDHLLTAIAGAFSLVIALGIGRFLFTPALPDMIAETSLTAISGGCSTAKPISAVLTGLGDWCCCSCYRCEASCCTKAKGPQR